MRFRRIFLHRYCGMFGDCSECSHSIVYHLPVVGCTKCDCEEFH